MCSRRNSWKICLYAVFISIVILVCFIWWDEAQPDRLMKASSLNTSTTATKLGVTVKSTQWFQPKSRKWKQTAKPTHSKAERNLKFWHCSNGDAKDYLKHLVSGASY